ncbi:MAG: DMT family transporter [Burkholderiales bacterium]|nr:DMT family transporter [Burkholderiales bacterium]
MNPSAIGTIFAILAAVGFSTKAIFVKLAYQEPVDAVTLLALRMTFSLPFFLIAAVFSSRGMEPLAKRDRVSIVILGILGYYLSSLFDFQGLRYISAAIERLVLFLYPTLVVLISAAIARRFPDKRVLFAIFLSYGGILLVFVHDVGNSGNIAAGSLLVFASALSYALYLVGAGRLMGRVGATRFTSYASIVSSVAILLQFFATRPLSLLHVSARVDGIAFSMALFSTVIPFFLLSAGIRLIGPGKVALIGSVGPVATIWLAHEFLGESFAFWQLTGSALVLAGVLAISWKPKPSS